MSLIAAEGSVHPCGDDFFDLVKGNIVSRKNKNVGAVVFTGGFCHFGNGGNYGTHIAAAVGGNTHPHTGTAQKNTTGDLVFGYSHCHGSTEIRIIIGGIQFKRTIVFALEAQRIHKFHDLFFEFKSSVVGGNTHYAFSGCLPICDLKHFFFPSF